MKTNSKRNTSSWTEMRDNGCIVKNVLFNENTAEAINALITRSFSSVNEYNWIVLNGSASKLKAATYQEKICQKANKKLYLGNLIIINIIFINDVFNN
ncbi:unnamed protein product [Rhizophagus irregularis]|nr:unnamed protein product [Rhizophagus irregularis]CAB4405724.1 unnamed protein product [Rhizophagus irregularis]